MNCGGEGAGDGSRLWTSHDGVHLGERGWTHEIVSESCEHGACGDEVRLRLVRLTA